MKCLVVTFFSYPQAYPGLQAGLFPSCEFPWHFRFTIIVLTHSHRIAVYCIVTTELIVCGVFFSSSSREEYKCKSS